MLHTKCQGHRSIASGDEDFLRFLSYIGIVAMLVMQGSYRNRKSKFQDFSRTFQAQFTFFQESFFIDSNSPNTAYTQDFCPI